MAYTVNQLKVAVAGFMQRKLSDFSRTDTGTTVDLLLLACNNARLYAERKIDFELSRVDVQVTGVTLTGGGDLVNAKLVSNGTTAVSVKKIVTPYLANLNNDTYPVDLFDRKTWDMKMKRRFALAMPHDVTRPDQSFPVQLTNAPFSIIQVGTKVFVAPKDDKQFAATFTLYFDVVKWLTPYTAGTENDFLLDNCFDWMMFYCIYQLNFFLKEDERVQLSEKVLNDTFDAMVKWNTELIASMNDSTMLD